MKSSAEALTRFFSALTGETPAVEVAPQTPNERRKAAEAADQELAKMLG